MGRLAGLIVCIAALCGQSSYVFAAEPVWIRRFGAADHDEEAWGVALDRLGGVYVAGQSGTDDDATAVLQKYDVHGNLIWTSGLNLAGPTSFRSVAVNPFGSVFAVGHTRVSLPGEPVRTTGLLAKFSGAGNPLFVWEFSSDAATSVAANVYGVFVCGLDEGRAFIKGFNHSGVEVWTRDIGEGTPLDVALDRNLNIYVSGHTTKALFGPNQGVQDAFVTKYDIQGRRLWGVQFGTTKLDGAAAVDATNPHRLLVGGYSQGSLFAGNAGQTDPFALALNPATGATLWSRQLSGAAMEYGYGVHATFGDVNYLGAWSFTDAPSLYKLDDQGAVLESNLLTFTTPRGTVRDVTGTGGGTAYLAGRHGPSGVNGDGYVARYYNDPVVLRDAPDYRWNYGCTPTSAGMLMGYWDRALFSSLVGNASQLAPLTSEPQNQDRPDRRGPDDYTTGVDSDEVVDALIASRGHHRDYWAHWLNVGQGSGVDPLLDGHADDSLADYLRTSQGALSNGATDIMRIAQGLQAWAEDRGIDDLQAGSNDTRPTFEKLVEAIDLGCPTMLALSLDGRGGDGHSVLAYGYADRGLSDRWFAVRDTWLDGDSDKKFAIRSYVDGDGVEWWKWNTTVEATPLAYVLSMNTFGPKSRMRHYGVFGVLSDSFRRIASGELGGSLGYDVYDASLDQSGRVEVVASPLSDGEDVLRMTSATGDPLAIATEVHVDATIRVSFDYLFEDPGKLEVRLGTALLARLDAPDSGAGAPGASQYATFQGEFDLRTIQTDWLAPQEFRIQLSGAGDPIAYLDNLTLDAAPAAIPEPHAVVHALLAALGCLARADRRIRLAASRRS